MQKIRITSTAFINPIKLQNIDLSFGMSYYVQESKRMKTYDESNSWSFKILAKINKIEQYFTKKDHSSDNEVINQIMKDTQFIAQQQPEHSQNLEVQINANTIISRTIALFSKINIKNTDYIKEGLESKLGSMYYKEKKMFLGLNLFKKGSDIYDILNKFMTTKEVVSYVYFHEYSHAAELENTRYDNPKSKNPLDKLYDNLLFLADNSLAENSNFNKLFKHLIKNNNDKNMPCHLLIDTLVVLYKEIYADTGSILLMRNKAIIEKNKNINIKNMTSHIINMRNEEKIVMQKKFLHANNDNDFLVHDHFTSPGLESLPKHLEQLLKDQNPDKILNEEEIHIISKKCVQEGIAKTILVMIEAEKKLIAQINIVCSIDQNLVIVNKYTNDYKEVMNKIYEIVPEQWVKSFKENLEILKNVEHRKQLKQKNSVIFDAGLHPVNFYKKITEHYVNIKESKLIIDNIKKLYQATLQSALNQQSIPKIKVNIKEIRKEFKTISEKTDQYKNK